MNVRSSVRQQPTTFEADDGVPLSGIWFDRPDVPVSMAVAIVGGAGIPAQFYHRMAWHIASKGAAVLAFDYRGIGASRHGSVRAMRWGMDDWARHDVGAAIGQARRRHPHLPLGAVAHSVGTLLIGVAPGAAELSRAVFLAPHTGYWGDYRARWRLPLFAMWHVAMPALTRLVGYFPARALRLGEDLPPQVALDWAQRRRRPLIRNARQQRRFGPWMARYRDFRAHTLALSNSDDAFAPPRAAQTLLAMYPNVVALREIVTPAAIGCRHLGHFGFLRRESGEYFWNRTARWLFAGDGAAEAVARQGAKL